MTAVRDRRDPRREDAKARGLIGRQGSAGREPCPHRRQGRLSRRRPGSLNKSPSRHRSKEVTGVADRGEVPGIVTAATVNSGVLAAAEKSMTSAASSAPSSPKPSSLDGHGGNSLLIPSQRVGDRPPCSTTASTSPAGEALSPRGLTLPGGWSMASAASRSPWARLPGSPCQRSLVDRRPDETCRPVGRCRCVSECRRTCATAGRRVCARCAAVRERA